MTGALARTLSGLVLLLSLVALPRPALGHGALKSSNPKAGAHLAAAPRELRLTFTEPAELAVTRIELLAPDGTAVTLAPLRIGDSTTVVVTDIVGVLVAGTYTVAWQVVGRDGHPVRGRFRFTIAPGATGLGVGAAAASADSAHVDGATATATAVAASGVERAERAEHAEHAEHHDPTALPVGAGFDAESPLYAGVRWLGYVAMLALVGTVGFGRVVLPVAARRWSGTALVDEGALRRVGTVAAAALLGATLLRLVAQSVAMHDGAETFSPSMIGAMLAHTLWGRAWMLQLAATVVVIAGFALAARDRRPPWMVVATSIVAIAVAMALSGHAAAVPGLAPLTVLSDTLHILGAGGWLGTLLVLVLVGLPAAMRRGDTERGAAAAALVHAFSPFALACAAVVAVTGVAAAWVHLASPSALWTTDYGRMLIRKLALLSLVVAIGAWNWRRVRPTLGDDTGTDRIRRSSIAELTVGALVLGATAFLVATPI